MTTNLPIRLLCGFSLALSGVVGLGAPPSDAAERSKAPVTVEAASGRTFTAEVDSRTDSAQLWLRWGLGSMVLIRPVDWEQVVEVQAGGERLSGEQFYALLSPPQHTGDARAGIRVYWIINLVEKLVEVYTDPTDDPGEPHFATRQDFTLGENIPLHIEGRDLGPLAVEAVLVP